MPTPYELLKIDVSAGNEEIQAAFDGLLVQYYANLRNPETHAESIEKIKQLTHARDVLLNTGARREYDMALGRQEIERSKPKPWRRLFARYLDLLAFFSIYYLVYRYFADYVFFEDLALALEAAIVGIALFIALETAAVSLLGTTLGKWMLSLKVTAADGQKPSRAQLARRNLLAVIFGCALYVPPFSIIAAYIEYRRIKKPVSDGLTSWDRACGTAVAYGDIKAYRLLFIIPALVLVAVYLINAIK
jgi:uncharacterized RDD family membrane protein YckC